MEFFGWASWMRALVGFAGAGLIALAMFLLVLPFVAADYYQISVSNIPGQSTQTVWVKADNVGQAVSAVDNYFIGNEVYSPTGASSPTLTGHTDYLLERGGNGVTISTTPENAQEIGTAFGGRMDPITNSGDGAVLEVGIPRQQATCHQTDGQQRAVRNDQDNKTEHKQEK